MTELEELAEETRGWWHVWPGVAGLVYARRDRHSPVVVLRAGSPAHLREQIVNWETRHPQWPQRGADW